MLVENVIECESESTIDSTPRFLGPDTPTDSTPRYNINDSGIRYITVGIIYISWSNFPTNNTN